MTLAENGASLIRWNSAELFWLLDALREPDELGQRLDDNQVYVCQIPKSPFPSCKSLFLINPNKLQIDTPIPDFLRLWRSDKDYYALRSNTPMTLDGEAILLCIE